MTDFQANKLSCNLGEALGAPVGPTVLDRDGAALDPAEFAQPLHKRGDIGFKGGK